MERYREDAPWTPLAGGVPHAFRPAAAVTRVLAAAFFLPSWAPSGARAMGRMPPIVRRFPSADGRCRVLVRWPQRRFGERLTAVFAARSGGGAFRTVSTFALDGPLPDAGFTADGGGYFLALTDPRGVDAPALDVYAPPSGRLLFRRKLGDLFEPAVLDSFAAPEVAYWATETRFRARWLEGEVRGVTLSLPWGQELTVNLDNGFTLANWADPRLRPEYLDEEKAWALFADERSTAARRGLLAYIGRHGSGRSTARLRALVDAGTLADQAARSLSRLESADGVFYRLLAGARSASGRRAAGRVLAERHGPGAGPAPAAFSRALREAARSDPDPAVRADMARWIDLIGSAASPARARGP